MHGRFLLAAVAAGVLAVSAGGARADGHATEETGVDANGDAYAKIDLTPPPAAVDPECGLWGIRDTPGVGVEYNPCYYPERTGR